MGKAYDPTIHNLSEYVDAFVAGDSNELHMNATSPNLGALVAWRVDGDVYMMLGDTPVVGRYWLNHLLAAMGRTQRFESYAHAPADTRHTFDGREIGADEVIPMPPKPELTGIRRGYRAFIDGVTDAK